MKNIILFLLIFGTAMGYSQESKKAIEAPKTKKKIVKKQRPVSIERGKFFEQDGKKMLYGGEQENQHFDITGYTLKDEQFHYGIGRERFPALLEPEFISVEQADSKWADSTRFLLAYSGNEVKAYSIKDLTRHEIVNDILDGQPIMAAYCILADLGAVYSRKYGENELTFALSGYTYYDQEVWDGVDAFVLWDRETESLWWPLVGKAVSGPLQEVKLLEMDKTNWEDVQWKYIKEKYPNAMVLKSGQDFKRPTEWNKKVNVSDIKKDYSEQ